MTMTIKEAREWLKYDARTAFFVNAMQFINWGARRGRHHRVRSLGGKSLGLLGVLLEETSRCGSTAKRHVARDG